MFGLFLSSRGCKLQYAFIWTLGERFCSRFVYFLKDSQIRYINDGLSCAKLIVLSMHFWLAEKFSSVFKHLKAPRRPVKS